METIYELETFTVKLAVAERDLEHCYSSESAVEISRPIYAKLDADQEHFSLLLLNNKNKIRAYKVMFSGSLTASLVHPREVYRAVCLYGAAAVIFVHNHPSGDPAPSPEDIDITRRLEEVGAVLGVRVLDHVILGDGRYFSFSDRGAIARRPRGHQFLPLAETHQAKNHRLRAELFICLSLQNPPGLSKG